jgi:hypothetical protein
MTKKVILALSIILLLASTLVTEASTNLYGDVGALNFSFESKQSSSYSIEIKEGNAYDESKDPTLRKGTENEEESQISFFIMPTVTLGIALLFLFFRQK